MTTMDIDRAHEALVTTGEALLRRAHADADRTLEQARTEAGRSIACAQDAADDLIARARDTGRRRAETESAAEQARVHRAQRAKILAAQRDMYEQLRAEATAAVLKIRNQPGYPSVRDGLRERAIALLGPTAVITETPDGGILGTADHRLVDLRLTTIATRAFERVEPEIGGLWE
ncbi:V-type ATP synthase subunit E family protein [Nocardia sp. NPDC049707]|uniref:V-type ATP synthase subunit E family protein n=1 Tax=Nocardia sp. NPDC049707 TaxID=3154735 RepID=UPI0034473D57